MMNREPYIDIVIGPQSYHKINDKLKNFIKDEKMKKQNLIQSQSLTTLIILKTKIVKFHPI